MHLIFCIDDKNNLNFNHRRVSKDEAVMREITNIAAPSTIYIRKESALLFDTYWIPYHIWDNNWDSLGKEDFLFLESLPFPPSQTPETIHLFKWNRQYPDGEKMPEGYLEGYEQESEKRFKGKSHPEIILETFRKAP